MPLWPKYKKLRESNPRSKIALVFPAKIVMDGRVVEDIYPDWNSILNGNRVRTIPEVFGTSQAHSFRSRQSTWNNIPPASITTSGNRRNTTAVATPITPTATIPEVPRSNQAHSVPPPQSARNNIPPEPITTSANQRKTTVVITPNTPTPNSEHVSRRSQSASPNSSKAHARNHPPVSPRTPLNTQSSVPSIQRPWDSARTDNRVPSRDTPQSNNHSRTTADSNHSH